jgi:hypothetical protein
MHMALNFAYLCISGINLFCFPNHGTEFCACFEARGADTLWSILKLMKAELALFGALCWAGGLLRVYKFRSPVLNEGGVAVVQPSTLHAEMLIF